MQTGAPGLPGALQFFPAFGFQELYERQPSH